MRFFRRSEPEYPPEQAAQSWPAVPPSLHHESFEVGEDKHTTLQPPPQPYYSPGAVTPWLGLRSRLSQVPMNRWTVLLLLVLARLLISLADLNTNLVTAKTQAVSACTEVEDVGSSMASMPHYLSAGVNRMAADGITKAVQGMVEILLMVLTGVQQLILFFIEFEIGTFLCLSTAIAQAVFELGKSVIEGTTKALNTAIKAITRDLNTAFDGAINALANVAGGIDDFESWLTGEKAGSAKTDIESFKDHLKMLDNVQIDTSSVLGGITDIEHKIAYDNVKNVAKEAIAIPFDMVKRLLNESYGTWEFDQSVFPIPAKESLSFCSDNSTLENFFEVLFKIAANAKIIAVAVLIILAVLACAVMAWWEIKRFNRQLQKSQALIDREPMDIVYISGRPLTAGTGVWLSERLSRDPKRQSLIRWVIAYATTYKALFVLALAVAGGFSCLCQWIIMRAVQQEVPALTTTVGDFAGDVVTSLEQASTKWANDSNSVILGFQDDINNDMFGYVRHATDAANDTINTFNHYMQEGLNNAFGGVDQLEKFMKGIIQCLIGNKLDSIQQGLTWVHQKARVTLPLFPADLFSVGVNESISGNPNTTTFLSTPASTVTDEITGAMNSVVDILWSSIIQEIVISLVLFLIYVAYVFFAGAEAAIRMAMSDQVHEDQGRQQSYASGRHETKSPTPRVPGIDGDDAVPETHMKLPARGRPEDPLADQDSMTGEHAGLALSDSRGRMGSPTPQRDYVKQSEYGWIQDSGR
ncbi:hypothetical protein N8I77_006507 [Diaporthe amygdali]|uniref:Plasma membrane fusion protein PRM1 n=1 Tax=Phomopsis amygdali TaxID=1214568 RepID=A0AAD9SHW9_PHOAM|nr:hypothetical protein N8I77_006507 [Diaporthe amygdali]